MTYSEMLIGFFASGVFLSIIGLFYKIGSFQAQVVMNFKRIDERFDNIDIELRETKKDIANIKSDISNLDKQISILVVTMRFNGFDFESHKVSGE